MLQLEQLLVILIPGCQCSFPFFPLFSTHTFSFPSLFYSPNLMKVWFLLPESLSGWIKSQLALVNHPGSFLGIGETFYLRLNFPPVLTWHGIYSCIESVITSTSEIPHSLELHYYGTFVMEPIAVSAPNWFILASVGTRWSEGGVSLGPRQVTQLPSFLWTWEICKQNWTLTPWFLKNFYFYAACLKLQY